MNIVNKYHKNLLQFKNKHKNEVAYIFGSGPSIKKFKKQEDGIFIGGNNILFNEYIRNNLNYYFTVHGYKESSWRKVYKEGNPYDLNKLDKKIKVFCVVSRSNCLGSHDITLQDLKDMEEKNYQPIDIYNGIGNHTPNIESESMMNSNICITMTQFALYCGFKKIYLVGCDCTYCTTNIRNYFWTGLKTNKLLHKRIKHWKSLINYKQKYYDEVKIININPIGLKNSFDKDIYI